MSDEITKEKIDELLTHTKSLINHIYWFKHDLNLQPSKEHIGAAINYTDIQERKDDFLKELVNTVVSWVYSKAKTKQILDDRLALVNFDHGNASSFLTTQAFSKFRPGQPQGQFGELLLFNFIQFFFMAAPLLRKQRITTSLGHERYGADAIHFKKDGNKNILILGESKINSIQLLKYHWKVLSIHLTLSVKNLTYTLMMILSKRNLKILRKAIKPIHCRTSILS
jgi:hypothetical protein